MGISVFPLPAEEPGGNDFIINKNNTTNNVFELGRAFEAGGYTLKVTGSTAYDIYLLDSNGSSVGYTSGTTIVATNAFETVSALGLGTADTAYFTYNGPSSTATASGSETGAGAYLTSISPSDLPNIDDTATVIGGNFATDVAITFTSGTISLSAKNIVRTNSTALIVTRPDTLIQDNSPYNLVAINPGVTPPSKSGLNVLTGTVTAGQDPSFITTSPIYGASPNVAFSTSILASDTDGTVVKWEVTAGTVPAGLALATATGVLSGTPTTAATYNFTVRITDDGGNTNSRAFDLPVGFTASGGSSTVVGGTTYRWFTGSDSLIYANASNQSLQYVVIAGGGGGGACNTDYASGGGGGAGGLLFGTATLNGAATATITVGGGGANSANGSNSLISGIATATGGGAGGSVVSPTTYPGQNGGSGGGGGGTWAGISGTRTGGTGTAGQGNNGSTGPYGGGGGGGGAGEAGGTDATSYGGDGSLYGAWASAINIIFDGGYFAGGGAGGSNNTTNDGGLGGGGRSGNQSSTYHTVGSTNSGGGGGGAPHWSPPPGAGKAGGSGLVIVRYT